VYEPLPVVLSNGLNYKRHTKSMEQCLNGKMSRSKIKAIVSDFEESYWEIDSARYVMKMGYDVMK